jgi:hypothetical protein
MKTNTITRKFGKLLQIETTFDETINALKITGDFFMHPEDTLEEIVSGIIGMQVPIQKEEMTKKLNSIIDQYQAELIGISTEDIVNTLDEVTR